MIEIQLKIVRRNQKKVLSGCEQDKFAVEVILKKKSQKTLVDIYGDLKENLFQNVYNMITSYRKHIYTN